MEGVGGWTLLEVLLAGWLFHLLHALQFYKIQLHLMVVVVVLEATREATVCL